MGERLGEGLAPRHPTPKAHLAIALELLGGWRVRALLLANPKQLGALIGCARNLWRGYECKGSALRLAPF